MRSQIQMHKTKYMCAQYLYIFTKRNHVHKIKTHVHKIRFANAKHHLQINNSVQKVLNFQHLRVHPHPGCVCVCVFETFLE